jgi:hypothetical protein
VLVVALIDAPLLLLVAPRVPSGLFGRLQWYLAGAAFLVFASIWFAFGSLYFWDPVYRLIFPAWSRWLLPLFFGLLEGLLALLFWWVCRLAARGAAVWVNPADGSTWVFVSNGSGLAALELMLDGAGNPGLQVRWTAGSGTSPLLVNGVLYYARTGLISALNPTTGSLLWSGSQVGGIHWQSPVVANGMLYLEDQGGNLTAFSLP